MRFYAHGTQDRSGSAVNVDATDHTRVLAEALNYNSIFPLEVVTGVNPVVFHEYICDETLLTDDVDVRWMQRYSGTSQLDVATWAIDDITITVWDGQCRRMIVHQEFSNEQEV